MTDPMILILLKIAVVVWMAAPVIGAVIGYRSAGRVDPIAYKLARAVNGALIGTLLVAAVAAAGLLLYVCLQILKL